jgi:peptide chain release factor subunit 1
MPITPAGIRQLLRRLADWPPTDLPVISAYLDLRPQATGQNPAVRSGQVVLRDRVREIERSLEDHTPAHESFTADAERINRFVEDEALPAAQGAAVFACRGENRFEALATAAEMANEVSIGRLPRLLPLARLADDEQAVVALADTNTLRLFTIRSGDLQEIGLVDDEPGDYSQSEVGGWSQGRFQRHVEDHRAQFAELAAEGIEQLVNRENAGVVVLAGDEIAIPLLRGALSQPVADRVRGTLRLELRATPEEVAAEALPFLAAVSDAALTDATDRLVGAVRGDGMGVAGMADTRRAAENGQVMELIVDPAAEFGEGEIEGLVRQAVATDARVRFIDQHSGLRELGGVGGFLRFRVDRVTSQPAS